MDLFVVLDTLGSGRIVGVFDSEARADEVVGTFGAYYKIHRVSLNDISPEAVDWALNDAQRAHLHGLRRRG